jgi:hypothetical protein
LFPVALCGLFACSVYDPALVTVQRGGQEVAGAAGRGTGGAGGNLTGFAGSGGTLGGGLDGTEDGGVSPPDVTEGPRCGDGRVEAGEKCDTGIDPGMPGACPATCETPAACQRFKLVGSGCQTECELITLGCVGGDGCCPADCDPKKDSDCSGMCGDGIVQAELGETCERSLPEDKCPAPSDCNDNDACTRDAVSGSVENCNAACTHTPITALANDDGCCPPGADANKDNDCMPKCGNDIREGDEACDGSTGCDGSCKLAITQDQVMCLDTLATSTCEKCACMQCVETVMACMASGDKARDAKCSAVEACAIEHHCSGMACYCGDASYISCPLVGNGPCRKEIEAAAGTTSAFVVMSQSSDSNTALGRALALGDCRRAQCSRECR